MTRRFFALLNHRDMVLLLAIASGLLFGRHTRFLGEISVGILTMIMVFSTIGFSFRDWVPFRTPLKQIATAIFLNYVVFGTVVCLLAALLPDRGDYPAMRIGLWLIAAAPAGPSFVAFTTLLNGNVTYSVNGVFGITLASVVVIPFIFFLLPDTGPVSPALLLPMLIKLIILPLFLSRFLRHPKVLPHIQLIQPTAVKWGFFMVIVPTIGLSRDVIFSEPWLVASVAGIFLVAIYGLALGYYYLTRRSKPPNVIISGILLTVIKSSAFSAVLAISFFSDPVVALPSAVLSVFVTTFYITFSIFSRYFLSPGR